MRPDSSKANAALPPGRKLTGWRRWLARLVVLLVVPLTVLALTELVLRLARPGFPTDYFVPSDARGFLEPNPDFAQQFYGKKTAARPTPFKMPATKPSGIRRIFVLGESAAAGTPDPAFSFSRILEVMLRRQFPGTQFEIYNVAMRGIDSSITRKIAADCARQEPDLFLVYMGNNDVIGLHGPQPGYSRMSQSLFWQRFSQALKSTRLGQLAFRHSRRASQSGEEQDMPFFRKNRLAFDDWSRAAVARNFAANLEDIVSAATQAGAQVLVASVPVNLRDCPPLGSLPRADMSESEMGQWTKAYEDGIKAVTAGHIPEAIQRYSEALRLDDHPAELHFRIAEAYSAGGATNEARKHFARALDRDALQFRADSRVNGAIQRAATRAGTNHLHLVDAELAFAASTLADGGVPGRRLFNDHVHPTFAGDHLLASAAFAPVVAALKLTNAAALPPDSLPSRDECARAIAFTPWDEINVEAAMVNFRSRPPHLDQADHARRQKEAESALQRHLTQFNEAALRQCAETYQAAIQARPDDWMLRLNFGRLLLDLKQPAEAVDQFELVVKQFPRQAPFRMTLADALARAGRASDALRHLETAQQLAPDDAQIPKVIAHLQTQSSPFARQSAGSGRNSR